MKILVIGTGAREHALLWKLSNERHEHELFVSPGNVGMDALAHRLSPRSGHYNIEDYADLALEHGVELTIVGPENYLVDGIVDLFRSRGLRVFGPTKKSARLEGSKVWAKEIMQRVGIPTAAWRAYETSKEARNRAKELAWRCVIKSDGLAAGKGSFVCKSKSDVDSALGHLDEMPPARDSTSTLILVEELLEGQEVSVFAVSDGRTVVPFGAAQDHKRLLDDDGGPNTGGMGAYSPVNHMLVAQGFADSFFQPLVSSLRVQGMPYTGILYAGAIVTEEGPKILEFNCRFGDPEAEVLLRRLDSDLSPLLIAATEESLHAMPEPRWSSQEALCVVAAANNYPWKGDFGSKIEGLDDAERVPGVIVFHAGTDADPGTREIVTHGGRVVCVTAVGDNLQNARDRAYEGIRRIAFSGMQYRSDIGTKALPGSWETQWRRPPRWAMQMRLLTTGLDSVATSVQRLEDFESGDPGALREAFMEMAPIIRGQLYDLKLRAILPEESGVPAGLRLTWTLLANYADQLAREDGRGSELVPSITRFPSGELLKASKEHEDAIDRKVTERSFDVVCLPSSDGCIRFERHHEYDLMSWDCQLDPEATISWLEKQRDSASAFYVDTKEYSYEFEITDTNIHKTLLSESVGDIASIRLETASYTCIWSAGDVSGREPGPTFAILSQTLLVYNVWWFMKGSGKRAVVEQFVEVLDGLQTLATENPSLVRVP